MVIDMVERGGKEKRVGTIPMVGWGLFGGIEMQEQTST